MRRAVVLSTLPGPGCQFELFMILEPVEIDQSHILIGAVLIKFETIGQTRTENARREKSKRRKQVKL